MWESKGVMATDSEQLPEITQEDALLNANDIGRAVRARGSWQGLLSDLRVEPNGSRHRQSNLNKQAVQLCRLSINHIENKQWPIIQV